MAQISKSQPIRPAEIELIEQVNGNTTNIGTLTTGLENEITNRTNADGALQNSIDAESNARTSADNAITNNVASLGESLNQTKTDLENEIANRSNADIVLKNRLSAETSERTKADSALQASINTVNSKFPVTNANLAANSVKEGNIADEQVTMTKLSSEVQSQLSSMASIPVIQYGTSSIANVAGNGSTDVTIGFGTTKTDPPIVICGIQHTSGNLTCMVTQVTASEFTARIFNAGSTDVDAVTLDYIALSSR